MWVIKENLQMVMCSIMGIFLAFLNPFLPLTLIVVISGNDEVGCIIIVAP